MNRVAVVGAGAWGTALALQAIRAGCAVTLVARNAETARRIVNTRESSRLPGIPLPVGMSVDDKLPGGTDLIIWAVPMQQLRVSLIQYRPCAPAIVVCAKGVEVDTGLLPMELASEILGDCPVAVLSGPNFAGEIAAGLPAASVVAARDPGLRDRVRELVATNTFRLYGNSDPIGVQLCGAAKNVIAIAAGAVIGAGLGENARAGLVTRGLAEIRRLIVAEGGHSDTAMGLSGLGDLLLTCTGAASRNFSLGLALGSGRPVSEVLATTMKTTEGVSTAHALVRRAKGVDLPICQAVAELLGGAKSLEQSVDSLLSRPQRDE